MVAPPSDTDTASALPSATTRTKSARVQLAPPGQKGQGPNGSFAVREPRSGFPHHDSAAPPMVFRLPGPRMCRKAAQEVRTGCLGVSAATPPAPARPLATAGGTGERGDPWALSAEPQIPVDTLRARWRAAFDAADSALRCAADYLPPEEVRDEAHRLEAEREPTTALLRALASDRHAHVQIAPLTGSSWNARRLLGVPGSVAALVLTLDGVLISSAEIHAGRLKGDGLVAASSYCSISSATNERCAVPSRTSSTSAVRAARTHREKHPPVVVGSGELERAFERDTGLGSLTKLSSSPDRRVTRARSRRSSTTSGRRG